MGGIFTEPEHFITNTENGKWDQKQEILTLTVHQKPPARHSMASQTIFLSPSSSFQNPASFFHQRRANESQEWLNKPPHHPSLVTTSSSWAPQTSPSPAPDKRKIILLSFPNDGVREQVLCLNRGRHRPEAHHASEQWTPRLWESPGTSVLQLVMALPSWDGCANTSRGSKGIIQMVFNVLNEHYTFFP